MPFARVQIELPYLSGIPEDVSTNTIYVETNTDSIETAAPLITGAVEQFFDGTHGNANSLEDFLSGVIDRTACRTKIYDMADPEPRVPVETTFTMNPLTGTPDNLPEEVALVLSLHGAVPITARRRGRLYIGPFNMVAVETATATTAHTRPIAQLINQMCDAASYLKAYFDSIDYTWNIYSAATPGYVPIVGGWVDNTWDTQRRRGVEATARTSWT